MMNRKAKWILVAALVAATMALVTCKPIDYYLQRVYKAYGTVTDIKTGDRLESVEVFIGSYQYSELTNGLGDYELELAAGTWTLEFLKDGYVTQSKEVTVDAANPRVRVDVALSPPPPPPPPAGPWILGCWVQSTTTAPHSMTFECRADGTFTVWDSYFATGDDIETYGTWSIEGSTLTGNSVHFGPFTWEITKVSDDLFLLPDTLEGPEGAFYRRGTEPGGWVFDQTPVPLSTGVWTEGDVEDLSMDLYSFTALTAGYYAPEFKSLVSTDPENPSGFPYVYAADKLTELSADWDEDEYDLDAVAMNAGNLIYIVVDARDGGGGTYAIRVVKVQ
jgi:hypothetical protein